MPDWKRIDLLCKTADLVAEDRRKAGREAGSAGTVRRRVEACAKEVAEGLRRICEALSKGGY